MFRRSTNIFASFSTLLVSLPVFAQAPAGQQPSLLESLFPIIAVFGIFYFLIIRPQTRRMKKHQEALTQLKKGDEVLTSGGILGTIEGITDKWVTLEIAQGVRIKALKSQIAGLAKDASPN
ncbi:MAG TPA: preprotein translocase subunit YajC [Bdellovibrionales bacterium]|nr:preprotein translocase subunit YajC [Bdellovibrionales bacterium]